MNLYIRLNTTRIATELKNTIENKMAIVMLLAIKNRKTTNAISFFITSLGL